MAPSLTNWMRRNNLQYIKEIPHMENFLTQMQLFTLQKQAETWVKCWVQLPRKGNAWASWWKMIFNGTKSNVYGRAKEWGGGGGVGVALYKHTHRQGTSWVWIWPTSHSAGNSFKPKVYRARTWTKSATYQLQPSQRTHQNVFFIVESAFPK